MKPEIEAKFLNVDIDSVRSKLAALGAKLEHPMRLMRRDIFDYPDRRYAKNNHVERLRIRDEGDKLTITYKKTRSESPYPQETETTIGSYENMKQLLLALGLESVSYQETRRETWQLGAVEVVIDEWPWLKPYIEIEGGSEADIKQAADQLGFSWADAKFGSVDTAYKAQYPQMAEHDSIGDIPEATFDLPLPAYMKDRL